MLKRTIWSLLLLAYFTVRHCIMFYFLFLLMCFHLEKSEACVWGLSNLTAFCSERACVYTVSNSVCLLFDNFVQCSGQSAANPH